MLTGSISAKSAAQRLTIRVLFRLEYRTPGLLLKTRVWTAEAQAVRLPNVLLWTCKAFQKAQRLSPWFATKKGCKHRTLLLERREWKAFHVFIGCALKEAKHEESLSSLPGCYALFREPISQWAINGKNFWAFSRKKDYLITAFSFLKKDSALKIKD